MKGSSYFGYAAIAFVVLCVAALAGYFQEDRRVDRTPRTAMGAPLSDQQIVTRRRAAMNTAAIADTTTQ